MIARGVLEILALCSKIFFGGDDAGVAEAELDLLKRGVALVRQYGEGPAQVVWRQFHHTAGLPAAPESVFRISAHQLHDVLG